MSSLGAIASMKSSVRIITNSGSRYHKEDFEDYISNPKREDAEASLFGEECLPVGIYDIFMPADKGDPHITDIGNLDKAQYNIRERFGHLSEDDTNPDY